MTMYQHRRFIEDPGTAISRGAFNDRSFVVKFGSNLDIDSAAVETVWSQGGI